MDTRISGGPVLSRATFADSIPASHVRSTDQRLAALIAQGAERSPAD